MRLALRSSTSLNNPPLAFLLAGEIVILSLTFSIFGLSSNSSGFKRSNSLISRALDPPRGEWTSAGATFCLPNNELFPQSFPSSAAVPKCSREGF